MKAFKKKSSCSLMTVFYGLILNFAFILSVFLVPPIRDLFKGSLLFLAPFISFSLLGLLLALLVKKQKLEKTLRKYLLLTGVSAAGVFPCMLIHNFIYGVSIYFFGVDFEDPISFLLALLILPAIFIFSVARSILLLRKKQTKQI